MDDDYSLNQGLRLHKNILKQYSSLKRLRELLGGLLHDKKAGNFSSEERYEKYIKRELRKEKRFERRIYKEFARFLKSVDSFRSVLEINKIDVDEHIKKMRYASAEIKTFLSRGGSLQQLMELEHVSDLHKLLDFVEKALRDDHSLLDEIDFFENDISRLNQASLFKEISLRLGRLEELRQYIFGSFPAEKHINIYEKTKKVFKFRNVGRRTYDIIEIDDIEGVSRLMQNNIIRKNSYFKLTIIEDVLSFWDKKNKLHFLFFKNTTKKQRSEIKKHVKLLLKILKKIIKYIQTEKIHFSFVKAVWKYVWKVKKLDELTIYDLQTYFGSKYAYARIPSLALTRAESIASQKIDDILKPPYVIHSTTSYWTTNQIARFFNRGLVPPRKVDKINRGGFCASHFPDQVSLSIECDKRMFDVSLRNNKFIIFVIDLDWVKKSHNIYLVRKYDVRDPILKKYSEVAKSLKIPFKDYYIEHDGTKTTKKSNYSFGAFLNEILCEGNVPITAIKGIIVSDSYINVFLETYFELLKFHPKFAIPVYDSGGKVVFPSKIRL